jgi:hypothetical protein
MHRKSETIIYILLTIIFFGSSVFLLVGNYSKFLVVIPFIIYLILITIIARNKKILEFVKNDFNKLGYELISERPLKSSESEFVFEPAILTSGSAPLKSYKNKYKRIFTAKTKKGKIIELNTVVMENKNGTIKIEIREKKKL